VREEKKGKEEKKNKKGGGKGKKEKRLIARCLLPVTFSRYRMGSGDPLSLLPQRKEKRKGGKKEKKGEGKREREGCCRRGLVTSYDRF